MNKNGKVKNMRNVWLSLFVLAVSIAGMLHTYFGDGWSKSTGEAAKMFPRIVYITLAFIAIVLLIREILGTIDFEPAALTQVKAWHVVLMLVLTSVFFMFVLYVGAAIGMLIYLFAMMALFDEDIKKNWKMDLLVADCATIVLYLIFTKVLPIITIEHVLF